MGLVSELREAALDSNVKVSTLLRMAKVVAARLNRDEELQWIDCETNGYEYRTSVPKYRHVYMEIKAQNPVHGLQIVNVTPEELHDVLLGGGIMYDSVSVLENLIQSVEAQGGSITHRLHPKAEEYIWNQMPVRLPLLIHVAPSACTSILEAVRSRLLDWALDLDRQGIKGDGMSFSSDERRRADSTGQTINIGPIGNVGNFIASQGDVTGEQHLTAHQKIHGDLKTQGHLVSGRIREIIKDSPIEERQDLEAALSDVDDELSKQTPDETLVRKAFRKVAGVAVALSSYAAQAAITTEIGRFLSSH